MAQVWNYAGGVGPRAYSFAFRFGVGGHNMIGQPDAWNTVGLSNSSLLNYYGVPAEVLCAHTGLYLAHPTPN